MAPLFGCWHNHNLPYRAGALPRLPPDGIPVVLGQFPPLLINTVIMSGFIRTIKTMFSPLKQGIKCHRQVDSSSLTGADSVPNA